MSKMSKIVKENRKVSIEKPVVNFMGGTSYEVNPLLTLKMVSASSIFGEPQYYRKGEFSENRVKDGSYFISESLLCNCKDSLLLDESYCGLTTSNLMERLIDASLSYDYHGTLLWASELRKEFKMRLNPQIIMVRAAKHANRVEFNKANPGIFSEIQKYVMSRADEPSVQLTYWLYSEGSKKGIPSILKRTWKSRLESSSRYEISKYKNSAIGIIDAVRISHANNDLLGELMSKGKVDLSEDEKTWNVLRSKGESWESILNKIQIPHMALLRNLRGIFEEINDIEVCKDLMSVLKNGVLKGKQFPYRYYQAYQVISDSNVNYKSLILDSLEECIDISLSNMPVLKGKTVVLSDNSGSAHGSFPSEYGRMTVAKINNLSAILTAKNAEYGEVYVFGDRLVEVPVSKINGSLIQAKEANSLGDTVGQSTENGVWLYLDKIIKEKIHVDNLFIYSDMQAGHGGLYGLNSSDYNDFSFDSFYIDVFKLIQKYRSEVNSKLNVFTIQTAGYSNVVIPEVVYRGAVLYGWTGKETVYANEMIKLWDEQDNSNSNI